MHTLCVSMADHSCQIFNIIVVLLLLSQNFFFSSQGCSCQSDKKSSTLCGASVWTGVKGELEIHVGVVSLSVNSCYSFFVACMCCLFIVCLHGNTFDHNNPIRGKVHIQSFNTLASDAYQMFSRLFSHRVKASFDCHLLLTETSRAAFEVDIFLQCTAHFLVIHKVWIFSCAVRCKQSLLMDPCHRKRTCFTFVFSKHIF
jgi:hypothetical protein